MAKEVKIFISYSHKNGSHKERLESHLKGRERLKNFKSWSDSQLEGGDEWRKKIHDEMESSHIILLLISNDFINSRFCYEEELAIAMSMHDRSRAVVIPVMLCPCISKGHSFDKLQRIPENPKSIDEWDNKERACMSIVLAIENKVDEILKRYENTDMDWRSSEIKELAMEGDLVKACNRVMDFCTDFSPKHKIRGISLSSAYNSIKKENKDDIKERAKLVEQILLLIEEVKAA